MEIKSESGQSTIEFIFTFVFGLALILMIFNTSINYATGYLVHYATFMASRVYLTGDTHAGTMGNSNISYDSAAPRAIEAFQKYNLSVMRIKPENFVVNRVDGATSPNEAMTVGTRTTFDLPMDMVGRIAGQSKLELVSESFLGKEPTRSECANRVCYAITGSENCEDGMDITLYDDGC